MTQNATEITSIIPLCNPSVLWCIDKMADAAGKHLETILCSKKFAFQFDESTLRDNEPILCMYVRFMDENALRAEIIFSKGLKTETKGGTHFKEAVTYFKEYSYSTQKYNGLC